MNYESFGERVRKRRLLMRMTQEELSEKVGISLSFLGHIERGTRKASLETLVALANALKISTDLLLQDSLDHVSVQSQKQFSPRMQRVMEDLVMAIKEDDALYW